MFVTLSGKKTTHSSFAFSVAEMTVRHGFVCESLIQGVFDFIATGLWCCGWNRANVQAGSCQQLCYVKTDAAVCNVSNTPPHVGSMSRAVLHAAGICLMTLLMYICALTKRSRDWHSTKTLTLVKNAFLCQT